MSVLQAIFESCKTDSFVLAMTFKTILRKKRLERLKIVSNTGFCKKRGKYRRVFFILKEVKTPNISQTKNLWLLQYIFIYFQNLNGFLQVGVAKLGCKFSNSLLFVSHKFAHFALHICLQKKERGLRICQEAVHLGI